MLTKALLLIDNCSAHPDELSSRDGSVTWLFLPPNTTSLIQPTDQGVLQAMKNRYKRKLLQKVICSQDIDQTQSIKDIVKLHTVKDALYMLSDAWYEGSPESICKAYDKLRIHSDNSESNSQASERIISLSPWSKCWNMYSNLTMRKCLMLTMWKTSLIWKMSSRLPCKSLKRFSPPLSQIQRKVYVAMRKMRARTRN